MYKYGILSHSMLAEIKTELASHIGPLCDSHLPACYKAIPSPFYYEEKRRIKEQLADPFIVPVLTFTGLQLRPPDHLLSQSHYTQASSVVAGLEKRGVKTVLVDPGAFLLGKDYQEFVATYYMGRAIARNELFNQVINNGVAGMVARKLAAPDKLIKETILDLVKGRDKDLPIVVIHDSVSAILAEAGFSQVITLVTDTGDYLRPTYLKGWQNKVFCVFDEDTAIALEKRGVDRSRIVVTGPFVPDKLLDWRAQLQVNDSLQANKEAGYRRERPLNIALFTGGLG